MDETKSQFEITHEIVVKKYIFNSNTPQTPNAKTPYGIFF